MASSNKKVTLEVAVKAEQENIDALEKKLDSAKKKSSELKQQKLQMKFEADTQALDAANQKLQEAENKLAGLKAIPAHLNIDVGDEEIKAAEREVEQLKQEQVNLQLQVESYKLDELQSKKDAIEADEINVQLNNQSAMQGLEQIADGFSRVKSAASEVAQQFGSVLESAGKYETNFKFLEHAIGNAETAKQKMSEIDSIVRQLPGDDTALGGLLSSAVAKDSSLTASNLRDMATSAADYMSAMDYYGKSATEAQQDLTNYILSGNTAELERSPILQGHIDKLKEATTVQERSKALAKALNEEHWGGMSTQDTYNNKLQEFNAMLETGKRDLGGMFQEGAKGGMEFLLKLNEASGGLVGMGIALGQFASPLTDALMGLGQMATGINAIKETKLAEWAGRATDKIRGLSIVDSISGKFSGFKGKLSGLGTSIGNVARGLGSGLVNGLKTAASGFSSLFSVLMANPIILVIAVIAGLIATLVYLYYTNEDVRNAINGFIDTVKGIGEVIYGSVMGAIDWLNSAWNGLVDLFTGTGDTIHDTVTGTFQWLADSVTGSVGWLVDTATAKWQELTDWLTSGAQYISDSVNGAIQWLTDGLQWLSDTITGSVMGAVQWLTDGLQWLSDIITGSVTGAVQWLTDQFTGLGDIWNQVVEAFNTYAPLVGEVLFIMATGGVGAIILLIANFMGMPNQIGGALQNVITRVASFVGDIVNRFTSGARQSVSNFMNQISSLPGRFVGELNKMLSAVNDWAATLPQKFWDAGVNAVKNFLNALGIHSPGYMQLALIGEMKNTTLGIVSEGKQLVSNLASIGYNAVKSWGNPELAYGYVNVNNMNAVSGSNASNGNIESLLNRIIELLAALTIVNNINYNHYGDINSTEKMEEILEYIRKYLYFNNDTAGRTV